MNEPEDRMDDPALSRLYRQTAQGEPSPALDAAILAAARQTAARPARRHRWWQRLGAPVALMATVALAVMLSLTVDRQPPMSDSAPMPGAPAEQAPAPIEQRQLQKAAPPAGRELPPASRAQAESRPAAKASPPRQAPVTAWPEAPRAATPPPAPMAAERAAERNAEKAADIADRAPPAMQEAAPRFEARRAAPAAAGVARPAATPAPSPEAWIEEIRTLRRQGQEEAAARRLAEFRAAYPDYRLPDDLR